MSETYDEAARLTIFPLYLSDIKLATYVQENQTLAVGIVKGDRLW